MALTAAHTIDKGMPGIVPLPFGARLAAGIPGIVPPWLTQSSAPAGNPGIVPPWLQTGMTPTAAVATEFVRTPAEPSPQPGRAWFNRYQVNG